MNPCQHGGICKQKLATYECTCPSGITGDNRIKFIQCVCLNAFNMKFLNKGKNCEVNIDECRSNPCKNQGSCVDLQNGFKCHCLPSFTGFDCSDTINPCAAHNCSNGGQCSSSPFQNSYTCRCPAGFTGKFCRRNLKLRLEGRYCNRASFDGQEGFAKRTRTNVRILSFVQ